ncbi:alkaline phosphatase D family protein [Kocuria marina]|uniref:alkaline phosphatase D family protein n=1 Tax=Kocuria marina TaxID=223184 RepID=UPI0022E65B84|nr:alkaline phosphatase D family protein [Kocuria marina]
MTLQNGPLNRRQLMSGAALAAAVTAVPSAALAHDKPSRGPGLVVERLTLPSGVASGDVTSASAVLWARSSGAGRLHAVLRATAADGTVLRGRHATRLHLVSGWAHPGTDHTAKILARKLPAGTRFDATCRFEDSSGRMGERLTGSFTTALGRVDRRGECAPQSFVWTADTAGQGYGINLEIGGMRGYAAMHATRPDFFLHSGDTIYADNPLESTLEVPGEPLWRNEVTEEVSKVAETLAEFRGRHRYNMMDTNLRAMYAEVPVIAQWDDHETTNNWWPGEVLDDPRYTQVRDVDTLAARGRQAWQEYMPIADSRALRRGTGFEPARIHRKIARGPHLDVFALDMRAFKSENTNGLEPHETDILGEEQTRWLIHELCRSRATWKVIGNDLPLGLVVPDGKGQESISNANHGAPLGRELQLARVLKAIKDHRIKNVVFLTGDVHYCAAHHYSPERAAFKDFTPFWEFVAGPINAGSFGPNELDRTFGPPVDFQQAGPPMGSPRSGEHQYFGHVNISGDGSAFTVRLINANGTTVYTRTLTPQR